MAKKKKAQDGYKEMNLFTDYPDIPENPNIQFLRKLGAKRGINNMVSNDAPVSDDLIAMIARDERYNRDKAIAKAQEAARVAGYKESMSSNNKRRQELGVQVNFFDGYGDGRVFPEDTWYNREQSSAYLQSFIGQGILDRNDEWKLLRRAKSYLARRSLFGDVSELGITDVRRSWTKERSSVDTILDLFSGLKYSYSSMLPGTAIARRHRVDICKVDSSVVDVVSLSSVARIEDVSHSHNVRLDPVDSPRELYRYRLRIQRYLDWAGKVGLVPVMMTLTVFHRWHPLKGLISLLKKAWNYFFTGTRAAKRRADRMGLCGYIRRMEETINKGDGYNSGWHPHYHVILFVPRDKLTVLSDMEDELRDAWYASVVRYFEDEFCEPIPTAYENAFHLHGLILSRHERSSERSISTAPRPPLRVVDNSVYLAKIMGYDSEIFYGGDVELTASLQKNSFVPFDLLREDTAENNDLWVEYALATKGEFNFYFSRSLTRAMEAYYEAHPDQRPVEKPMPERTLVAQMRFRGYQFFYRIFGMSEFLEHAVQGFDSLFEWCRSKYIEAGLDVFANDLDFLPIPPGLFKDFPRDFRPKHSSSLTEEDWERRRREYREYIAAREKETEEQLSLESHELALNKMFWEAMWAPKPDPKWPSRWRKKWREFRTKKSCQPGWAFAP